MSFALLLPAGLIALAALALPLLIHLRRRSQYRPIQFAALRWLVAREVPRRQIRLDERWLLTLRLLLLVLLALLLAVPVLFRDTGARPWVVVVPGADWRALPADSVAPDAEWHWLAPGFPDFTQAAPAHPLAVSSLIRELDSRLAADVRLTAIVPVLMHGLDGERPILSRAIDWHIVPATPTTDAAHARTQQTAAITVAIRYADDPQHKAALRWLDAAIRAWNAGAPTTPDDSRSAATTPFHIDSADVSKPLANDTQWLFWVSDAALPDTLESWVRSGGTALLIGTTHALPPDQRTRRWRSTGGAAVDIMPLGSGRLLVLAHPLTLDVLPELIEPTFPDVLQSWLRQAKREPQVALASSQRPRQGPLRWPPAPIALDNLLLLVIVALWGLERWLATRASRIAP